MESAPTGATGTSPLRWVALFVFSLAAALNYLDRQLLSAFSKTIMDEFSLNAAQYGLIVTAYSIPYALAAPFAGMFLDRTGLNLGAMAQVAAWSVAGMATSLVGGFTSLLGIRATLGVTESGFVPAGVKAGAVYLAPRERTFATAFNQVGITIGMMAAPLLAAGLGARFGWRMAFAVSGALGLLWVPVWWLTSRAIPPREQLASVVPPGGVFSDRRLVGLAIGNMLVMTPYSLWINWTTLFLMRSFQLTESQANQEFAWMPPVFGTLGGFAGSAIAMRLAATRTTASARIRTGWIGAVAMLATALAPQLGSPAAATAVIAWSLFWTVVMSANTYALPIDYFGPGRAATGVSLLTASYGLMQAVLSPGIGWLVDKAGFAPVCAIIALLPLAGMAIVDRTRGEA
jgi:MFS transporter, ACS family, hexuronate transporter